jgi:hypothetical protein
VLLGEEGRLPFLGHFRAAVESGGARLSAAGRVAVDAYRAARRVEVALRSAAEGEALDRFGLLRRAWERVGAIPAEALGPGGGGDLVLVLLSEDAGGIGLAGVGLSMVWGLAREQVGPLVSLRHPLLCPPGRPSRTPGVLNLEVRPTQVIGAPSHHPLQPPDPRWLAARTGQRGEP